MRPEDFCRILLGAMAGSHDELETLLELYMPLINKHSCINGKVDEDLRQYIMIHIALNISKFPI